MENTVSAAEAAALLDVSLATLYAYVSRGMLRPLQQGRVRNKRYLRDEVLRLAARKNDGRRAGHVAERAVRWGLPIMESRITSITDGVLRYRGFEAVQLARSESFERTAQILWGRPDENFFAGRYQDSETASWHAERAGMDRYPPLHRAMALLPMASALLPRSQDDPESALFVRGARLIKLMASAMLNSQAQADRMESSIAAAWKVDAELEDMLRCALVLCADHELNPSTFTARCVASTGAALELAMAAALGALSGARHGGESVRTVALIDAAAQAADIHDYLSRQMNDNPGFSGFASHLPGFGHPLYPEGDPRGRLLLDLLAQLPTHRDRIAGVLATADAGQAVTGRAPNIDFGLAALEWCLHLPPFSSQVLFAIGRSAGWIAHAAEQISDGQLIRPRARYVGTFA
jgi:citrate synthase